MLLAKGSKSIADHELNEAELHAAIINQNNFVVKDTYIKLILIREMVMNISD